MGWRFAPKRFSVIPSLSTLKFDLTEIQEKSVRWSNIFSFSGLIPRGKQKHPISRKDLQS